MTQDEAIDKALEGQMASLREEYLKNRGIPCSTAYLKDTAGKVHGVAVYFTNYEEKGAAKKALRKYINKHKIKQGIFTGIVWLRHADYLDWIKGEALMAVYKDAYRERHATQKIIKKVSDNSISFKEIEFYEANPETDGSFAFFENCKFVKGTNNDGQRKTA